MAEVLGVASGIAGCVSLALELSKITSDYINNARHTTSTVRSFGRELTTLHAVLTRLHDDVQAAQKPASGSKAQLLQQLDLKTLQECNTELLRTKEKLQPRLRSGLRQSLLWPFKETETRKIVESLQRHCATFDSAITLETFAVSNEILKGTKRTADVVEDVLAESQSALKKLKSISDHQHDLSDTTSTIQAQTQRLEVKAQEALNLQRAGIHTTQDLHRLEVWNWVSNRDASALHNMAWKSHQSGTGQWFLDSAVLKSWLAGDKPVLWVYGGQGIGKTVLASTVIENVFSVHDDCASVAYHYFSFTDSASQSIGDFLRSVIRQLGSTFDAIPQGIQNLYDRFARPGRQPSVDALLSVLAELLPWCDESVLVVDAIDESADPEETVKTIASLLQRAPGLVKIFMTGRPEKKVVEAIEDHMSGHYLERCIEGSYLDHDIEDYIQRTLDVDTILRRKTAKEKVKIRSSLAAKANGMFRWVSCQFDALRNCRTTIALTDALDSLPRGLEETYNRIFDRMSGRDRHMACVGLQLLLYTRRELSVTEFAEAITVPISRPFDPDSDRLIDGSDILDICSGLISIGPSARLGQKDTMVVRLGHLSVHDYLVGHWSSFSKTLNDADVRPDQFDEPYAHQVIGLRCLRYLSDCPPGGKLVGITHLQEYPFLDYTASFWHVHAAQGFKLFGTNELLLHRIVELLQTSNPAFLNWLRIAMPHPWTGTQSFAMFRTAESSDVHSPCCYARALNLPPALDLLLAEADGGVKANAAWPIETVREFGNHTLRIPCGNPRCRLFLRESLDPHLKSDLTHHDAMNRLATKPRKTSAVSLTDSQLGPEEGINVDTVNATPIQNLFDDLPPKMKTVRFELPFDPRMARSTQSCQRWDVYYDQSNSAFRVTKSELLQSSQQPLFHLVGTELHCAILTRSFDEVNGLLKKGADPDISAILQTRRHRGQQWSVSVFALALITNPFDDLMLSLLSDYGADVDGGIEFLNNPHNAFCVTVMETLVFDIYNAGLSIHRSSLSRPVHAWLWWFVTKFRPRLERTALLEQGFEGWRIYLAMLCASEWVGTSLKVHPGDECEIDFFWKAKRVSSVDTMPALQLAIVDHADMFYNPPNQQHEFSLSSVRNALTIALTKQRFDLADILISIYTTLLQHHLQNPKCDSIDSASDSEEVQAHYRFLNELHRLPVEPRTKFLTKRMQDTLSPTIAVVNPESTIESSSKGNIRRPDPLRIRNTDVLRFKPWRDGPFSSILWDTLFRPLANGQPLPGGLRSGRDHGHSHDDLSCQFEEGKARSSVVRRVIEQTPSLAALNLAYRDELDRVSEREP